MTHKLNVKETGNKAARFHYTVTDETGAVISERRSNRKYVACTVNGENYFGRIDLAMKHQSAMAVKLPAINAYRKDRGWDEITLQDLAKLDDPYHFENNIH